MSWLSKNRAVLALVLAVSLLTARWIWLVGNNWDFGFTYESAARLSDGQAFGKDFFVTVPPLSSYTESVFVRLLHGNLWSEQIHLFLWWSASLAMGYLIIRRLIADQSVLASALVLTAIISAPPWTCGLVYNYVATALTGLTIYCLLAYMQNRNRIWLTLVAGVLTGLIIVAKQNVGAVMVMFFGTFLFLDLFILSRRPFRESIVSLFLFGAGAAVGFGLPFFDWARNSSADNIFRLLFVDGVAGKGGLGNILQRAIPRLALADIRTIHYYRFIQIAGSFLVIASFLAWTLFRLRALRGQTPRTEAPPQKFPLLLCVNCCLAICCLISLVPIPALASFGNTVAGVFLVKSTGFGLFWGQFFYLLAIAVFAVAILEILGGWLKRFKLSALDSPAVGELFVLLAPVALTASITTSSLNYLTFATPVLIPVLIYQLHKRLAVPMSRVNVSAAIVTVTFFLYPGYTTTFQPIERLPGDSPYANLYGTKERSTYVKALRENLTPRIAGRRTLWLSDINIGPAYSYGVRFAPNVIAVYTDTHSPRVQEILFQKWNENLPDIVVRSSVMRGTSIIPEGSRVFADPFLSAWLTSHYTNTFNLDYHEMWAGKPEQFEVWERQ